jgi:integrase
MIKTNVADSVNPPRSLKKEITPLNEEEVNRFFKTIEGHPLEAIFVLAVTTGLRRGEILGLHWKDIDLEKRTLEVKRSLALTKGGPVFNPPKTTKGKRSVGLSRVCVKALIKHKSRQKNNVLVFPNQEGEPRRSNNVLNYTFDRIKKKGNLPDIRFHDLRHTCATLLLGKGVHPKIVQEMLGHSTISITLDTYSHVLPNLQKEAVKAMEDIFE